MCLIDLSFPCGRIGASKGIWSSSDTQGVWMIYLMFVMRSIGGL